MKGFSLSLLGIPGVLGSLGIFSVHDDLLAYPQYEVVFSDTYILEQEAQSIISAPRAKTDLNDDVTGDIAKFDDERSHDARPSDPTPPEAYERMTLDHIPYLCSIPSPSSPSETNDTSPISPDEQQKELTRATSRGWELLQDMEGNCLYFISGWWSYSFCYNKAVTQFHQLTPGVSNNVRPYPPVPDPNTPSFVLGKFEPALHRPKAYTSSDHPTIDSATSPSNEPQEKTTEAFSAPSSSSTTNALILRTQGSTNYLSLTLTSGTTCDLTGQPRKVEVQFHCQQNGIDRIGWIKETTTCAYLMIIYTPRLCNDVAFIPAREERPEQIQCTEIIGGEDGAIEDWARRTLEGKTKKGRKSQEQQKKQQHQQQQQASDDSEETKPQEKQKLIIGDILVGGHKRVGGENNRISVNQPAPQQNKKQQSPKSKPNLEEPQIVARNEGHGGPTLKLSNEELSKRGIDPDLIDGWIMEMERDAEDREWRLEVVPSSENDKTVLVRGLIEPELAEEWEKEKEATKEKGKDNANADADADADTDAENTEGAAGENGNVKDEL